MYQWNSITKQFKSIKESNITKKLSKQQKKKLFRIFPSYPSLLLLFSFGSRSAVRFTASIFTRRPGMRTILGHLLMIGNGAGS